MEEGQGEREQELTKEKINEIRSETQMVGRYEIGQVPDSYDEDANLKKDLELKKR